MKGENSGEDGAETEEEYDVCNSNEEDLVGDGSGGQRKRARTSTKWPKDMIVVTGIDQGGCQQKGTRS